MKQEHYGVGDNIIADKYFAAITKNPTILADVVNSLTSAVDFNLLDNANKPKSFSINRKIDYNNVVTYAQTFNQYKIFQGKLDVIYNELEQLSYGKKTVFLTNINDYYLKLKGSLIREYPEKPVLRCIKDTSDLIIEQIENYLISIYEKSSNGSVELEFALSSIRIVLVDAFMRCKILEEPKNDN